MKTYKNIDIKYYDNDGNIHVRCSVPVTQDALVHYELMQSHYCKLSFKLYKPTYFLLGDFIDTPYGRFELIDLTKAKDNDTIGYSYEIQFDAYYRKFKNKILKYRPNTGSQEATFSLTSKISTHVEVIMKSLAYYAKLDKSYLYDPKFEGEGTDYTYVIDASVDANAAKLITYSNTSVLDAIANIAQTFECEWWFEGNILHFGTCENTNAIVDFRLNDNIVSMSSSQSQSTYANRVYAFGAARNLPSGYKNDADADITKDGVVEKRLMLPTSAECSDKNKQLLAENGFELKNGYIQVGGLHEDQYVEGVTTNDDIYPRNLIKTSNVTSYEKDVEDESTPEEGDYIKRTFYRVNSLTIVNDDGEKTGDMAFRKAYILSGKNLHIVFQSGSLNGMDFECEFNPDGVSEILKDDDGNPILKDGIEQINPKSQVFEIVANEDYGRFLPDITLHPKDGDTFVLYNWDSTKLGETLVSAASNELLTDSIKNLKKSIIDPTTYTCTAEANYSFNQGRGNLHGVGDRVNLYNKGYDDSYRSSRVIGYEFSLDIPFDGAKYYVGEKPSYSRLNAMESKIEELVYNGQSYLNGNGGSGRSIYIIKSYDSITPTDYNVFSAKAVDEQRLNKTKDDTAKGTITWEKVQKFFSGLLVGNPNNENGGSWTPDAEGRSHLITDYLEVRMKAIFEELVINKTSTIGGKEIISPAGGVVAHKVEEVTVTYNNVSQKAYRCYFLAEQDGDAVDNDFAINDQVRSESFNVRKGTYHKAGNHFYWRLAIGRDEEPVELEGKKYHYIDLSDTDCATASDVPAKGDVLNQCGNRTDVERQNCLIFSAVDTYSPSISLYHGINSYSFANREYVEYGVNKQTNKAFFNVYGDMYVGDRPTKENGYEGSSYIRYDSSTKQLSVKGKISAKSTVDGKELSQYIKENTDDTVANEAKKAAEDAQKAAQTAQTDITNLGNTVTGNKKEFDNYVTNGYLEPSEIAAMAQDSKRLEDDFAAAQKSYNEVKEAEVLANTNELIDLKTAFDTLTTAKTELVTYLSDISARYNKADTNGKATIVSAVGTKFTNFQSAYASFYDKLGLANAYITRKIYGDLGVVIGDVATYQYLKKVLADGVETEINGGLILTSLIALRDPETKRVESGINGVIDKTAKGNGIATWWGGYMNDGEVVGFDKKEDYSKQAATSLVRFDGSGYLANGAIWWGTDGRVHADPTSFIISEKNLGAYLTFFEPTWKAGSAGTSVADLVSLKPNAPFTKLGVSGDATFEGAISFHGIKLTYDSTNKAIKIDGNLYATGGITAYGAGASTTGGGGLNGSVKSYSNALKLTSESLSEIASAYSIKALDSRISSLEGGSATAISVSGSGNAVTSVTKNGTTISVVKGSTFLTSHQSLDGYVNAISVSGSGNAITSVSKSGKGITFTKGSTFLTSHQSLSAYLKSADAANTYLKLSGGAMTGNIRYKGSKSTYDMITFVDNNADTYGNGICIGGGGLTIIGGGESANAVLSQHTSGGDEYMIVANDAAIDFFSNLQNGWNSRKAGSFDTSGYWNGAGFKKDNSSDSYVLLGGGGHKAISSLSVNYASSAGSASSVAWSNVSGRPTKVSQFTNDYGYITSSGSCAYATSAGNADKVDGIHANGLLTALSNSDKGISITVGGTTKSISNIGVNYASSAGNADTVDGYHVNGSNVAPYGHIPSIENDGVMEVGKYIDFHNDNSGKHDFSTRLQTTGNYGNSVYLPSASGTLALTTDNVASATKLQTPRTIWGQSFDGTGNVDGTLTITNSGSDDPHIISTVSKRFHIVSKYKLVLYAGEYNSSQIDAINILSNHNVGIGVDPSYKLHVKGDIYSSATIRTAAKNQAIMLTNDSNPAWISALEGQVIFNTGKAIRFGETAWDWNQWAGLKYTHSDKTIYLGIANGSIFNANSPQSDGTLRLAGIKTVTPDSGARIGNSGADLYLGNASNSAWVKVQDICSQTNSSLWSIRQNGNAYFNSIIINSGATFNGPVKVNNMLTARGIMFTTADSNAYGTSLKNWDGSIGAHVTNMFNGIDSNNISIEYSTNGGSSWLTYTANPNYLFNLINDNSDKESFFLGNNVMSGSSDADKLTQIKKNQLRVTIKIPPEVYQELAWISVDVNNGVSIKCQVYLGNSSGVYTEYVSKVLIGWSHRCDICVGPLNVNVGNDSYRYVRLVFSHLSSHTSLRNGIVSRIRALALTKYNNVSGRYNISTTGHIYNYDYNMNTYFPNSILAKGGVTAYQSSDIRLKTNITKLNCLKVIKSIGGTYEFDYIRDHKHSIGFIAQNVNNPLIKDIVAKDDNGYLKINYWNPKLISLAFGALTEIDDEVNKLKARVRELENEVEQLKNKDYVLQ